MWGQIQVKISSRIEIDNWWDSCYEGARLHLVMGKDLKEYVFQSTLSNIPQYLL